ncbi:DMT family transporter [Tautonia sociabilis]|uniref:DMT family transporter n=1 Tax=Tautonia sociabilis TaxID=2080755 RepID=A0A432MFX3_9BACT|nr:DMT family transporter [Tautonia sociabilis]RUL85383.1 DMT family transporter [Tautonia sociabilis]
MPDPETSRPLDFPAVAGVVLCCALWGGNAVAVKFAVPDIPPFGCAALRFLLALPMVALVCRASGQPMWVGRNHFGLIVAHAMISVLQIGTFNWGTSLSLAGRSSVFINVHPLVVAPLSWIVLGERMGPRGIVGLVAASLGVAVLLGTDQPTGGSRLGDTIILLSGAIFGAQTIAQKRTFPVIPPATLLFAQYVLAIPMFLAYSAAFEGFETYRFTPGAIWGVLFQGVMVSGVCFSIWMMLLGRYQANRIASFAFLTPLFGVAFGSLFRGEALRWELVAAGALVGTGIFLVARDRVEHREGPALALPGEDAP